MKLAICVTVFAALLCLSFAAAESDHDAFLAEMRTEHPVRESKRNPIALGEGLSDRLGLMFRALDKDHDRLISKEDVLQSEEDLAAHLPGISAQDFAEFIEVADKDGDKKLSHEELNNGMAEGMQHAGLLELASQQAPGKMRFAEVDNSDDACVMCQYIVERCETNVRQSGALAQMASAAAPSGVYLELESKIDGKEVEEPSFLETAAENPFDVAGAQIIGSTRQSTRFQRLLERQKFNEVYRVVDITLDDVCEQGMPNSFYGYCKMVYQVQSDVVDGLRYQYRPADICFRIGMCGKNSYITAGIHSRYK